MKAISIWAGQHRIQAILLLLALHLVFASASFLIGVYLFVNGIDLPAYLLTWLIGLFLLLSVFYPSRSYVRVIFGPSYRNRKLFDAAFLGISFCTMLFLGNVAPAMPDNAENAMMRVVPIVEKSVHTSPEDGGNEKKVLRRQWREWKQDIKELRREIKAEGGGKLTPLWIVLICIGFTFLWIMLLGLSCRLSCMGMETLSLMVFLFGTALLIFLLIVSIRALRQTNKAPAD